MKHLEKNIVREIRRISDERQVYFKSVWDTYVQYLEEGLGEIPDVLEFNKDAYEKTKQYYLKYNIDYTEGNK